MEYLIELKEPTTVDRVVIQEDIKSGELVLEYVIEGKNEDKWVTLSSGTCIGHKRIETFNPQTLREIKLSITKAKAKPQIKNFSVYKKS